MNRILKIFLGLLILSVAYYLGKGVSILIYGFISPSIIGMLILFLLLEFRVVRTDWIEDCSELLIGNLMLFFIPITLCIVLIPISLILKDIIAIILAFFTSSFAVLWVVAAIVNRFENRRRGKG